MSLRRALFVIRDIKVLQRTLIHRRFQSSRKSSNQYMLTTKLCTISSFTAMGIWGLTKKRGDNEAIITTKEVLIAKADALYEQEQYQEIHDLLINYKDSGDIEIIWRLCRAMYKLSKIVSEVDGKKLIFEAYDLILEALEIKEDNWAAHKWASILLNSKTLYEGVKAQIKESYNIKKHMLRAMELNPKEPTLMYMLGTWCYQVADLTWYQRKIASVIFGEPPSSSFEEALKYFETAEEIDPNFYSQNLLMLGKTYLKLNQKELATKYLKMALDYPAKNEDDRDAKQEAQKLLKKF
ncbi:regulator of microtubule dynamics protein 1-like isoform X1 [Bombus huntii]|uniref:regulator of microtubule dynamics protein 1-like n=1 Tax=Bombus huntii TaxID=85661 RepID=UPI0021AAA5C4|nr:regulator of microtubule dynamics protein 1-like [Bombus huntii]XP_050478943.1 regulator of microtubule dynamics protein 1-like isoform X1 [Bombus huntii]XP_050478950.1 regulator of microtubule dynamics protein 1-like isoform X1 [Bombus huntii]XP_050478953.1 regulator of microtubule dynamics protein 1-like [Bombus huntii]XP_050478954.1 regulator of microtubule dynamics protein 1-like [Bombus huntii]XP_050486478.1 regulator of microtubule dynamics protein 1-like isoform X1 [Bombus huntii]XP